MSHAPNYFKFHIGDYLRDAHDLSPLEHGVYLLLMLHYYSTAKPLSADLDRLYRRVGATSKEEKTAVQSILGEFFTLDGPVWRHKRIDSELENWRKQSELAMAAVAAREQKKGIKNNPSRSSFDDRTMNERSTFHRSNQNQNQNHNQEKSNALSGKPDLAIQILEYLNLKAGRGYRQVDSNLRLIRAVLSSGCSLEDCKRVIDRKVSQWKNDQKMDEYMRPKTLFGKVNFEQYLGELEAPIPGEKHWTETWSGIVAKGKSLGITQNEGEPDPEFKARVMEAA